MVRLNSFILSCIIKLCNNEYDPYVYQNFYFLCLLSITVSAVYLFAVYWKGKNLEYKSNNEITIKLSH